MLIFLNIILILFFFLLLIKAADILIINLKGLSRTTRLGQFVLTGLLMALTTSLPELFVGITSALEGKPQLSLGNIIGANIANLSLVVGGAALAGGTIAIRGNFLSQDVFYAFLAGAVPMVLLLDKQLGRVDGLILILLYGLYCSWILNGRKKEIQQLPGDNKEEFVWKLIRRLNTKGSRKELGWIFLGVILLLFSADMIVNWAQDIAIALNLPLLLVGIFIISVGTTLPELIFELKAIRQHHPTMVFGNLLGSVVANGTLIIGLVALLSPIKVVNFGEYLIATMAFVLIFGAFYLFIRTKHQLERWEGAILIGLYLVFFFLEALVL